MKNHMLTLRLEARVKLTDLGTNQPGEIRRLEAYLNTQVGSKIIIGSMFCSIELPSTPKTRRVGP